MADVVTGGQRLGMVVEGVGQHVVEGNRAGGSPDGDIGVDDQRTVRRIVHRLRKGDLREREVVLLLGHQVVVRSALRLDLGDVGGAFKPQFEQLAALGQLGGAGLELLAGQPHAPRIIDHVEIGLHGPERDFVAGQLQLLDALQTHHLRGADGVDPREAREKGHLSRSGIGVVEIRDVGVSVGLGIDRTAETRGGADRTVHRGDQRGDGGDVILPVVAVGVILPADGGTVFDGIAHAGVERHRGGGFRGGHGVGNRRGGGCGDGIRTGDGHGHRIRDGRKGARVPRRPGKSGKRRGYDSGGDTGGRSGREGGGCP